MALKKIAVLTSGGDSPSMNAAIYGFLASATQAGVEVYGVIEGYKGLVAGNYRKLDQREFKNHVYKAGTEIGSSRCLEFKTPEVRKKAVADFEKAGFDGLFVIGGDGSYMGASLISELGCKVVAAPGTVDNDVASSVYTIGFFSTLEEIYQGIKKVKATSDSHSRITFVEAMGRRCNDLTVMSSLAGVVDYVITNENIKTQSELEKLIKEMIAAGKKGIVILVTERTYGEKHGFGLPSLEDLASNLEKAVGREVRATVLGYIQRGATPTSWDLYMSHRFGMHAFELMKKGKFGYAIGFNGENFYETLLTEAVTMKKKSLASLVEFINSSSKI